VVLFGLPPAVIQLPGAMHGLWRQPRAGNSTFLPHSAASRKLFDVSPTVRRVPEVKTRRWLAGISTHIGVSVPPDRPAA
jgi:hypothetical protein